MSRRKGELSTAQIDRQWPYQVALADVVDHHERYARSLAIEAFCKGDGIDASPRGFSFVAADRWHQVYCFATAEQAAAFRERFGGEPIKPKDRPKWGAWTNNKKDTAR